MASHGVHEVTQGPNEGLKAGNFLALPALLVRIVHECFAQQVELVRVVVHRRVQEAKGPGVEVGGPRGAAVEPIGELVVDVQGAMVV
jgi:hypothetical protein